MQAKQPINRFLPMRFKRGGVVKQFSKPCIKCGQMLQANQMEGIVRLIDDHMALAAEACCPKCQTRFGVACVINNEKQVRRVALPAFLFGWYLRLLPLQAEEGRSRLDVQASEDMADDLKAMQSAAPVNPPAPAKDYPRSSESLGQYQGKGIPSYIVVDGRQLPFDRIALDGRHEAGEYLLDGLFIYK